MLARSPPPGTAFSSVSSLNVMPGMPGVGGLAGMPPLEDTQACTFSLLAVQSEKMPLLGSLLQSVAPNVEPLPYMFTMMPLYGLYRFRAPHQTTNTPVDWLPMSRFRVLFFASTKTT